MVRSSKLRLQYSIFNSKCLECGQEFGNCPNEKTLELRKRLHNKIVHKGKKVSTFISDPVNVLESEGRKDSFDKKHMMLEQKQK